MQLEDGEGQVCGEHPTTSATLRWIFQLEIADATGRPLLRYPMLFHDVAVKIPGFLEPELPLPAKSLQKVAQRFRTVRSRKIIDILRLSVFDMLQYLYARPHL